MSDKPWTLLIAMVFAILIAVVFEGRNRIQSLEEERNACTDQKEKDRNKINSLEEERSAHSDPREKLSFEAGELQRHVTRLKEKQRETDREYRRSSAKLAALEESLEKLEDEQTAWKDERERHKIRDKHLKQQLDYFKSQLKTADAAINEEKIRRLKTERDVEALRKDVLSLQTLLPATALSGALKDIHTPTTGNSNSKTYLTLIKEFKTQAALKDNKSISIIAKLNEDIFVITSGSNIIERFDSVTLSTKETFSLQEHENMKDLQPCIRSQSLFIIKIESAASQILILDVDPYNRKILASWAVDNCSSRFSVTEDCHVLVTCPGKSKIIEYSSTGHLIQEIVLKPETGIVQPLFALKMANGNFLVSYNGKTALSYVGVAIVNSNGEVLKSYSEPLKKFEIVSAMTIDRLGNVMVAELYSCRVILLSPDLEYERDIMTREHGIRVILAILLDEVNGRLFVADSDFDRPGTRLENGRVLVFDMK